MRWIHQRNMRDALRLIPDGKTRDVGFSTPDIYGRAYQLYLALRKAQGNAQLLDAPEVRLWRGLLTLPNPSLPRMSRWRLSNPRRRRLSTGNTR